FSWLVEAGHLAGNPLALSRRKRRQAAPRVSRFLPQEHWDLVKAAIEAMPIGSERERLHASRCRWLFSLLYIGGLRVSE
ncbi:integrase, partial [Mycolicibacterium smegmatis]